MTSIPLNQSPHLTEPVAVARRWTPWWAVVPLAVVIFFASQIVLGAFQRDAAEGDTAVVSALSIAVALVLAYGVRALLVWAWVARYERRGWRTLGFPRAGLAPAVRGFGLGLAMFGVVVAILAALGVIDADVAPPRLHGAAAIGGVLIMLVAWAVQGSSEEVFYRGFVLQALGARGRLWVGVLVSTALFAVGHIGAWASPIAVLNLSLFAVLACLYALREGGLWGVAALHASWNWAQGNVFGLTVSGQAVPGGALLDLRTGPGSALVTGGQFGPEASLVTSAVLLLAIAGVRLLRSRVGGGRPSPARTAAAIL